VSLQIIITAFAEGAGLGALIATIVIIIIELSTRSSQ